MSKKTQLIIGIIISALVIGFGSISYKHSKFEQAHQQEAVQMLANISKKWEVRETDDWIDQAALEIMQSDKSRAAFQTFANQLGRFIEADDIKLLNYHSTMEDGTNGAFLIKARFDHAAADVKILLNVKDKSAKLLGIQIETIAD